MQFDIAIQIHTHPDGSRTLHAEGPAGLSAWHPEDGPAQEDLELALLDRVERTHPSLLHRFQAPRGLELVRVEVPRGFRVIGEEGVQHRELPVDVLVEPAHGEHLRLRLPAFDASLWIGADEDLEGAVSELVTRLLEGADLATGLTRRDQAGRELIAVSLEAEAPGLAAFTGEHANTVLLPEPAPEKTPDELEEEKRVPTPTLHRLALAWSDEPDVLEGAAGRDDEVAELLRMLERPGAAVVVVGAAVSGKSAVIEEVVKQLEGRQAWFADASRLVNADAMTGWRAQTLSVVSELAEAEGLWLVGDPLALLDAGKHVGSEMNVAQVLKPFLSSGRLRVLGECSEAAWGRLEARDAGFARLFTPWRLPEPPAARTRAILDAIAPDLPVPVEADGVTASLELAQRYGPVSARLGTAAHFLRRLAAEARALGKPGPLGRTDVLRRFCGETGLPELLVRDDLPLDTGAVRSFFTRSLVGQDRAVDHLVDLVAVIKGGMSDLDRPLGSFLFVGPTGVGKTEAAKTLARWLFGGGRHDGPARLLRFDMSEYGGPDCVARLLDPSAGLVAAVRRRPFAVVLLDEIEKAHPAVFDLLLQVLGEARLSDADGVVADFRNTVVLLTSNLGIGTFRRPTGFGTDATAALQDHVLAEVERFFRPELFNRIDKIVPFAALEADAIGRIARREVADVGARPGLRTRGVELQVRPEAVDWIAERGVDPRYGARPLQRAVQTHLTAPLARHLSEHGQVGGVRVAVGKRRLRFENLGSDGVDRDVEALRGLMERLSELRFVAAAWSTCRRAREARHEVELVDRLMTSKRFWRDQEAATARSNAIQPRRDAVQALLEAREALRAVEDLVHEAWQDRDLGDLPDLQAATEEAATTLRDATLSVVGATLPDPDRLSLVFYPPEADEQDFWKRLIVHYLDLVHARGWTVQLDQVVWPEPTGAVSPSSDVLKRILRHHRAIKELKVRGRHCATLLKGETGAHRLKHPSTPVSVPIRAVLMGDGSDEVPKRRVRLWDPGRRQVQDTATKLTTTLHAQGHRSLERILELRFLVEALGLEVGTRIWKGHVG